MADNVPLRDFDEESDTDSETELLIRREVPAGSASSSNNSNRNGRRKNSTGYSGADFLGNLFGSNSVGSAAGQIRYRNERSRERAKHSNSYNSVSKLAQLTHTSAGVAGVGAGAGTGASGGSGGSGSGGAGDGNSATTSAGCAAGDLGNGGTHSTVVDPENGSSTVFYQHNRRKSKSRSIGNVCKLCLCR